MMNFPDLGPLGPGPMGPWALMGRSERWQFLKSSHHPSQPAPRGRDKPVVETPHWDIQAPLKGYQWGAPIGPFKGPRAHGPMGPWPRPGPMSPWAQGPCASMGPGPRALVPQKDVIISRKIGFQAFPKKGTFDKTPRPSTQTKNDRKWILYLPNVRQNRRLLLHLYTR